MPPKKTQAARARDARKPPVKKKTPQRPKPPTFESDDSSDSLEPKTRVNLSQTLLGPHNTLKQLLSGQSSQSKPKPANITPPRKTVRSAALKISLSPINSASTPISLIEHAKMLLGLPQERRPQPIRFDDIEIDLPPPKKRRQGRPSKRLSPSKANRLSVNASEPLADTLGRTAKAHKTPRIEEFPEEDGSYMEQASHHLTDLTGTSDILPPNTRRSSYSNRGKRALSIGNGFVAKPHSEVSERDYYKLLDPSMSEPSRMRQLLSWCFRKTIETKKGKRSDASGDARTTEGIAKVVERELLDEIIDGTISTSWYSMDHAGPDGIRDTGNVPGRTIIRPNPLNEANKESIEVFKNKLQSLRAEKAKLLEAYDSSVKAVDGLSIISTPTSEDDLRAYLRRNQSTRNVPETVLDNLVPTEILLFVQQAKESVVDQLELNIDKLHHLLHGLKQGANLASAFDLACFESGFANIVQKYVHREDGKKEPSTKELLQGIAKLDCRRTVRY